MSVCLSVVEVLPNQPCSDMCFFVFQRLASGKTAKPSCGDIRLFHFSMPGLRQYLWRWGPTTVMLSLTEF